MNDYSDRRLVALDHVEDLLEAYADARLTPSGPVLARMRASVLAHASTMQAIDAAAGNVVATGDARSSRWTLSRFSVRRPAFAVMGAASLVMVMTAGVLAAPPGSPFFNARVVIETAFLPSQPDARLEAHDDRLAVRLAEAAVAASQNDAVALAAALAAYEVEVEAAFVDVGDDASRLTQLQAMLAKHVAVLTELKANVPEKAAIGHALESSQKAIEKIKAKGKNAKPSDKPGGPPANQPGRN